MIMSNQNQRRPFLSINDDDVDARLEQLAAEKGVGKMEKPRPAGNREGEGTLPPAHADALQVESERAVATPRSKMKTVNLELPDYLWTDLKIRGAHKQTSVRHVIIAALIKDGFPIKDADMIEDGRRLRGSNKLH